MPTKPKAKPAAMTAWSYSRWSDWNKCPALARFKHVDKIREPDNEHQARGSRIHKEAEGWSTRKRSVALESGEVIKLATMPKSLACFKSEFDELRKIHRLLVTEEQMALDAAWQVTDWFDSDARSNGLALPWLRVTMDCRYVMPKERVRTMRIIDYKTGKVRDENEAQLSLYALAGLIVDPSVEQVLTELWYLDQGELRKETWGRAQLEDLKRQWLADVRPLLFDVRFKPRPSKLCSFCHYRKSNAAKGGGQCRF